MFKFFKYLILLFILLVLGLASYIFIITRSLPDPELFDQRQISQSTKIYDRTGNILLYEIHGEEKRTVIPFNEIPDYVKQATLTIEDSSFYTHAALDWRSIIRAFFINITRGRVVQGGSTITQQLAKKAFLSDERTVSRKIKELFLSLRLEKKYTKDEILELYLNQIPYGSNAYGIEAAAQTFFNKKAKDLNLAEASLLTSLPNAPTFYSPYGTHFKELMVRKNYIIEQMSESGLIDDQEKKQALSYEFKFAPQATNIKAPHFVITIQEYLNNKYGDDYVQKSGLKVITTLDWNLQQLAEKVITEGAARNTELYKGKNASLVAQDPRTGQILALVGSKDYFDIKNDGNFNVAIQGLRQPGSAIKPFTYVTAFKQGYTPNTVIFDTETDFDTTNTNGYIPQNFDNKFRGPITMRNALAQSINIPAVKTLYLAGIDNTLKTAEEFGITTLTEKSRYGLSLTLGGGEIKLIELVGAYSVFAQNGIKHKQSFILNIKDDEGNIIEEYKDEFKEVIDPKYVYLINDILSDIEARKPLYSNSLYLTIFPNQEVALKTGTTNDYRDAWSFGYTPSLVVGVWVGNNDNSPLQKSGGSILASLPIWNAFLLEALKDKPLESFERPKTTITNKPILNGEYIINDEIHNILHYVNKRNPQGDIPSNPDKDSQYKKWEEALIKWLEDNPNTLVNIKSKSNTIITINQPTNGSFVNNQLNINAQIKSNSDIVNIKVFLNNNLISQQSGNFGKELNYQEMFKINLLDLQNILLIKTVDSDAKETEKSIIIYTN